jgi:hypothetical protein
VGIFVLALAAINRFTFGEKIPARGSKEAMNEIVILYKILNMFY